MAEWSQSQFLHALGWATLNSFWQMGLLWILYILFNSIFRLSSSTKYRLSVAAIIIGFGWFCLTFFFFEKSFITVAPLFQQNISQTATLINICLLSASIAYLVLLIFPSIRLIKNWNYVKHIKKDGLKKAALEYRLFTQKLSARLNINKKVSVFVSDIVSSPLTIGYLKPIILLPVAALSNLTPNQVEAILLHELTHIRRSDYLINLMINVINTVLYFNPFVKLFMRQVDAERENCCDELVLQFGYDNLAYASALLTLEKTSASHPILALGVTGKKNLLTRIEKIIGMEKKKPYSLAQLAPVLAALICIFAFNSVLLIKDTSKGGDISFAGSSIMNPYYFIGNGKAVRYNAPSPSVQPERADVGIEMVASTKPEVVQPTNHSTKPELVTEGINEPAILVPVANNHIIPVAYDEVEGSLTTNQKEQVKTTIDATKKVLTTLQWEKVEASMADAMTSEEKNIAKEQYMKEVEAVNWNNLEKNLKANYDNIQWLNLNIALTNALTTVQLDSLENNYRSILIQLTNTEKELKEGSKNCTITPLPDNSITDIQKAKEQIKKEIEHVNSLRNKKVIRL
jgi:beta-lactamase regulating signal transducer with metallopeptidase domain